MAGSDARLASPTGVARCAGGDERLDVSPAVEVKIAQILAVDCQSFAKLLGTPAYHGMLWCERIRSKRLTSWNCDRPGSGCVRSGGCVSWA